MPATIIQNKTYAQNTPTSSFTVTLDTPATAGNEIIIFLASDAYFMNPPIGFTEPAGARQERYLGHYAWRKTATGNETSFTLTPQVNCTGVWAVFEISGLSGVGSLLGSAGQAVVLGGSSSYSTPNLSLSAGERFVIAAFGGSYSSPITTMSGWTNSFLEVVDIQNTLSSGTRDSLAVAVRQGAFTADQSVGTTAAWDGGLQPESRTAIILAFNIGDLDTTLPTVPSNIRITSRTANSLSINWDASTDSVMVAGYDVQVDGTSVGTTVVTNFIEYGLAENANHTVRVRAFDTSNNYSALSTPVSMFTLEHVGKYTWVGNEKRIADSTPVDPATHYGLLNRVPWEGGPSYYNTVPAMTGTQWTDDTFFPIGYWGAYVDEHIKIDNYATLGINTLWTTYNQVNESAGWIRNAGLWNMGGALANSGSEHLGYVVEDEADMWAGAGWGGWTGATGFVPNVCTSGSSDCGYTIMQQTAAAYPNDGKMRWTNYGIGVMTYLGEEAGATFVNGGNQQGSWPMHLVTGDMYFYTGGGSMVANVELYFGRDGATTHRAGNYGELIMTKMRHLDSLDNNRIPIGVVVELGGQFAGGQSMTPDRVEGAVWSSIIHEARCISYFSHAFADTTDNPWSSNVLNDSNGNYPQIQARVMQINTQVTQLAPVLNTQSYEWNGAENIASMLKIKDGYAYIFAMAKVEVNHSSAPRSFRLPFGITGKTVEVMFENRTLKVRSGAIIDSFADETTHHIYKIAL